MPAIDPTHSQRVSNGITGSRGGRVERHLGRLQGTRARLARFVQGEPQGGQFPRPLARLDGAAAVEANCVAGQGRIKADAGQLDVAFKVRN